MYVRRIVGSLVMALMLCTLATVAQPGDRYLDIKAQVLDILFPLDVGPRPYLLKLVLRYGDSDTQYVVVLYPGQDAEMVSYSLAGISSGEFANLISSMTAKDPKLKPEDIAAKLRVEVKRTRLDFKALSATVKDLEAIRVSPLPARNIAVDDYSSYEYWCDSWQEYVHYTITGGSKDSSQKQLLEWMIKFRSKVPHLMEHLVAASQLPPRP